MAGDQKPFWVEQFKIDQSTWDTLNSQAQKLGEAPLAVAIDMGLLNENKLLQIDRDNSGLASLKSIFFNGPQPTQLLTNHNYTDCRKKACMPIAQWNGLTYWAKISSCETGLEKTKDAVFLLAPWTALKKWFELWEKQSKPSAAASIPKPLTEKTPPPAPQGLKANGKIPNVDMSKILGHDPKQTTPPPPEKVAKPPLPDPLMEETRDLNSPPPIGKVKKPPLPPPLSEETKDLGAITGPTLIKPMATEPAPTPVPEAKASGPTPPPIPSDAKTITTFPAEILPEKTQNAAQQKAENGQGILMNVATIPTDKVNQALIESKDLDELSTNLLGGWNHHFDASMILLVEGQNLQGFKAAGHWLSPSSEIKISLDEPSMFKIVNNSKHPYHGPASRGPTNDNFFKQCHSGTTPQHITIIPVMVQDDIIAMVVGIATTANGAKVKLPKLEELTKVFSQGMAQFLSQKKKAS